MLITWDNGTAHFKKSKQLFDTNIYSYIDTSGGQSSNLYLNVVHFLTLVLIEHQCLLKTVVFQHSCLKQEQDAVLWNIYL